MDFRSVPKPMYKIRKGKNKRENASIKVVYISTPMKVKTSASRFRALVQELTGRDSNVATLMMEGDHNSTKFKDFEEIIPEEFGHGANYLVPSILKHEEKLRSDESPSSSEDMSKHLVDVFSNTHQHQFHHHHQNMEELAFPLDFIYESSLMDILNSYDQYNVT